MIAKYLFVGNRKFVLEEMIKQNCDIEKVLIIKGSYLQNDINNLNLKYQLIDRKDQLIKYIHDIDFDILISNGCPFILPISKLPQNKKYLNIHPSYLPDLKGVDPTIGSILFQRDSGATCHYMNDLVDSGDIVSRVKIPISDDLDVSLLYQLSFIAEKKVFELALKNDFFPECKQEVNDQKYIYYTRKPSDILITLKEPNSIILQKIKAFSNKSQGAYFMFEKEILRVFSAEILANEFLVDVVSAHEDMVILFSYENSIVFKKDGQIIKFSFIEGKFNLLQVGKSLV
jgi:methionyl-tRNA formyltransferase